jgi:GTPase SAR1 family protein
MPNNWQEQKTKYLEMLKKINGAISSVLEIDQKRYIVDHEMEDMFKKLFASNTTFINKLDKEIFEVAMIGLEKSGKSSLANALIASNILPTNSERCTYTTTQIEYGETDEAFVEFFTSEDFNTEIFNSMLKGLKYTTDEDFEMFRLSAFTDYFEHEIQRTNKELYDLHKDTTFKDIKEIKANNLVR